MNQETSIVEAQPSVENIYTKLAAINVNAHIEKKNNLSYLSWAWAVDQLLRNDPTATWSYMFDHTGSKPYISIGDTAMVFCTVRAFGIERTAQLPVMDYKNKAIPNPDAFQLNTAMQRALAKAIALHGLGIYIYAGEDIPLDGGSEVVSAEVHAYEPLVSTDEIAVITSLADKVGVPVAKILKAVKVSSIEKMRKADVAGVIAKLQAKAVA